MKTEIKKWGINGEGIAYLNKKAIFVDNAIPGEIADIEITQDFPAYSNARAVSIEEPSPRRRKPLCPNWETCGGCSLMHVDYKGQVRMKDAVLKEALRKYAGYEGPIEPIVKNPNVLAYRNACKLPLKEIDGKIVSGMYAKNSNDFVAVPRCLIHSKALEAVRSQVMDILNEYHIPAANREHPQGLVSLVLKEYDGKVHVVLVSTKGFHLIEEVQDKIMELPDVASLWQSRREPEQSPAEIFGKETEHLKGEDKIHLHLGNLDLNMLPRSFFQLNTAQALNLYETVVSWLPEHCDLLVEAYSGIGAISLFAAKKADKIYGIEWVEDAVENARENAKNNNADNLEFFAGDAGEMLKEIASKEHVDVLIADPPRAGLDDAMIEAILDARPKMMIYISCNPSTLAKNLNVLMQDYVIRKVQPFDMFSQTAHVETAVLLEYNPKQAELLKEKQKERKARKAQAKPHKVVREHSRQDDRRKEERKPRSGSFKKDHASGEGRPRRDSRKFEKKEGKSFRDSRKPRSYKDRPKRDGNKSRERREYSTIKSRTF